MISFIVKGENYLISIFFLCLISWSAFGQKVIFERELNLRRGFNGKRESYPLVNNVNGELALFMIDANSINLHLFGPQFNLVDTIEGPKPKGISPNTLLGSNQTNGQITLFYSSNSALTGTEKLSAVIFNRNTKAIIQKTVDLNLKNEKFVGAVTFLNQFYYFTAMKASSILKVYRFNEGDVYTTHTFDFNNQQFGKNAKDPLYKLLTGQNLPGFGDPFMFIESDIPNSLDIVSKPNKVYAFSDKLVLTFDHRLGSTEIITIDPNSMTAEFRSIKKPALAKTDPYHQSSNSFLLGNNFFQINVNADEMIATILDYSDEKIVQTFHVLKDDEIAFKNTSIIQEGGSTIYAKEERELSKTKQFLRKVAELDAGISAYRTSEGMQMTMGGLQKYTATTGGFYPMGGAPGIFSPYGTVPGASPNPIYQSYGAYTATKAVYF